MGERIVQTDFLQICPEGSRFPFTRSLRDVLTCDFLATVDCIRKIYIPNYSSKELAGFPEALLWVTENRERFFETGFRGGPEINTLPMFVQEHQSCSGFLHFLLLDCQEMPSQQSFFPVAYAPGLERWQKDIGATIRERFEQLRDHPAEAREFNDGYDSTTRSLSIIHEAFSSDWSQRRAEASDLLTSTLFVSYWVALKKRIRSKLKAEP